MQHNGIKFCKNILDFIYFTLSSIDCVLASIILGDIATDNIFVYIYYSKMLFVSGIYRVDDGTFSVYEAVSGMKLADKPKYSNKTCSRNVSTTDPIRLQLGSNPARYDGKLATNHLRYSTAKNILCNSI
jgi:hypothetical protein